MKLLRNPYSEHSQRIVRRFMALLLGLMILSAGSLAASAEINSQIVDVPSSASEHWRITTFSGEMPEDIAKALSENGFRGYTCYSGAMLEQMASQRSQSSASSLKVQALIALEKDGERVLVGMVWKEKEWGVCDLGAKALLPGREFTISATNSGNSMWYVPIRFTITYPLTDGGSETYGLQINNRQTGEAPLWNVWYQSWYVNDYTRTEADGRGITILNADGAFRVFNVPYDKSKDESFYPAFLPCALEYMGSITDFPTSDAEAKRLAESSFARFEGTDLAVATGGVNLRKYPTTTSQSLGKIRHGVLVQVLGEEKGWNVPWYHVRMGQIEGFISGTYLKLPHADDFARSLVYGPLTVARALRTCTLKGTPENDAAGTEIPANTLMHVLADVEDGWLYVMVPQEDIGWEMDTDGMSGYVQASEVVQGAYINERMD